MAAENNTSRKKHSTVLRRMSPLVFCVACEDCPPVDMAAQDEDRGFYAETFYSSAWVYQGDDSPGTVPPSLNSRTRAVSSQSTSDFIRKMHAGGSCLGRGFLDLLFTQC